MFLKIFFATAFCFMAIASKAQSRYIVSFKNKGGNTFSLANPQQYLSARSIARRAKYSIAIDSSDLPITQRYVDSIKAIPNVTVLAHNKWFNRILIRTTDPAAITKINSFPFVQQSMGIGVRAVTSTPVDARVSVSRRQPDVTYEHNFGNSNLRTNGFYNYGTSLGQINLHNGQYLHDKGFRGNGMLIAVFDAGFFQYTTHSAFDSVRANNKFVDQWDFVANQASVTEDDSHGLNCLGIIGSNKPGTMVGSAPEASFAVYRTEDVASEYPVEEIYWAAGAERADSIGADMISSSLGYYDFDNPIFNYTYAQMDGNTTYVTKAANLAIQKGIFVSNSAGNEGNSAWKHIIAPADGPQVAAIAACDVSGGIASFSSYGFPPPANLKPDLTSVGIATALPRGGNSFGAGNGTSYSNPNLAGLMACLWQAFPTKAPAAILQTTKESSNFFTTPNDRYGYGIPNFKKAWQILKKQQNLATYGNNWLVATPNPFMDTINVLFVAQIEGGITIQLVNSAGIVVASQTLLGEKEEVYSIKFLNQGALPGGAYQVRYADGTNSKTVTINKNVIYADWFIISPNPVKTNTLVTYIAREAGTAQFVLTNRWGQVLETKRITTIQNQLYNLSFDWLKLAAGVYQIQLLQGQTKRVLSFIR
jgi:serine protease AprX